MIKPAAAVTSLLAGAKGDAHAKLHLITGPAGRLGSAFLTRLSTRAQAGSPPGAALSDQVHLV